LALAGLSRFARIAEKNSNVKREVGAHGKDHAALKTVPTIALNFVNLTDAKYLASGLVLNVERCVEVLDATLTRFNEQTGIPEKIVAWNEAGGNRQPPLEFPERGRLIFEIAQHRTADQKMLYTVALFECEKDPIKVPVVFISLHSPSLDIPMRVEIPLRALLRGGPPLRGTYSVYLHSLRADDGNEYIYYGITKRGWNKRFSEHIKSAMCDHSKRSLPQKLRELTGARARQLAGEDGQEPKLTGIISALCGVGLDRNSALAVEDRLIEKYSLSSKFIGGLNMISGTRIEPE
jgi:hypothetical protein